MWGNFTGLWTSFQGLETSAVYKNITGVEKFREILSLYRNITSAEKLYQFRKTLPVHVYKT